MRRIAVRAILLIFLLVYGVSAETLVSDRMIGPAQAYGNGLNLFEVISLTCEAWETQPFLVTSLTREAWETRGLFEARAMIRDNWNLFI